MKISKIITYPVKIGIRNQLLVKVETDEGVYGWGKVVCLDGKKQLLEQSNILVNG